jgi:hypothetical protein
VLNFSLHTINMRSKSLHPSIPVVLTSGRVIREVLTEATKAVKPSKASISGRLSFMKHNVSVISNAESIVNLKKKMDNAFEEFFVSGPQLICHARNTKINTDRHTLDYIR